MELLSSIKSKVDMATANDFQRRVLLCLSNDAALPPLSSVVSLCLATYNWSYYHQLVEILLPRIAPPSHASQWRATYKALVMLEQMLLTGNDELMLDMRHRMDTLHALEVGRIEDGGQEVGGGIREVAKRVRGWVLDLDTWRTAREESKRRREGYTGPRQAGGVDGWKEDGWGRGDGGRRLSWKYGEQEVEHYDVNSMRREEQEKQRRRSSSSSHALAAAEAAAAAHGQHSPMLARPSSLPPAHPSPYSVPIPALLQQSAPRSASPPSPAAPLSVTNPKLAAAIQSSGFRPRAASHHAIGAVPFTTAAASSTYHTPQLQQQLGGKHSTTDLSFLLDEDSSSSRAPTLSPPPHAAAASSFSFQPSASPPPPQQQQQHHPQQPAEFVPDYILKLQQ
jgi:hypothetical protein